MITLNSISKRYGTEYAVHDMSITVEEGEFAVLIGPSGCGKSTTLRMINRMVEPTDGSITVDGRDVHAMNPVELRRGIGYVIQSVGLFPHMSVAENIAVVPNLLGNDKAETEKRSDELLDLFGLDPSQYRAKFPSELSGGEAQRVGVARALAADPPILLMDEPFGALDPITRETLQGEFSRIQRELKKTIVFVTHDMDEAVRLATNIAVMKDGELQQYATPEEILTEPSNAFVRDFIGTDNALKRLSRMSASEYMRDAPAIAVDRTLKEAREFTEVHNYVWVIDGEGRLLGWLSPSNARKTEGTIDGLMTRAKPKEYGVQHDDTLKDALSRILHKGAKVIPVVDRKGVLLGEVEFSDLLSL